MVVGDDNIKAYPFCLLNLRQAGDATINSNNQTDTLLAKVFQGRFFQAVAFRQAVRDVRDGLTAKSRESLNEQGGGGYAVSIIVSVDGNFFTGE